jgi:hypothetical protein
MRYDLIFLLALAYWLISAIYLFIFSFLEPVELSFQQMYSDDCKYFCMGTGIKYLFIYIYLL